MPEPCKDGGMAVRPYVVLSCAMSLDGYIDDASPQRLILSNPADLDRVDEMRASVDAILVGAGTIRRDNPRLLVRSAERRAERIALGRPESPIKVTLTRSGDLNPAADFFAAGSGEKIVYALRPPTAEIGAVATVVVQPELSIAGVFDDLAARGIKSVLVEGGSSVLTECLGTAAFDELQLVIAPFFVGDRRAPRFVGDGPFRFDAMHRLTLLDSTMVGDCALLTLTPPDPLEDR
jgi:5-amino-6-(5-phosphoribosylamino)uracil reductase